MKREEEIEAVAQLCRHWGAEAKQAEVMARQLLKRAEQLADERGQSKAEALNGLLELVIRGRQGEVYPPPEEP